MRPRLTRRLAGFGTTIFTEISRLAAEAQAVNLGQGFPDFDGPEFVKEAATAAIRDGHGQYARMAGILPLTRALAAKYRRDYGLTWDGEAEITVTSGATEALWAAIGALCDVGDEVVVFEPFYDSYRAAIHAAGATPRAVTLHPPAPGGRRWTFDPARLRGAINARTRLLLLNTPHNPTGKVFTSAELQLVADLAIEHDLVVVADEVYEHLVYEGRHIPIASLPGMRERTVTISSLGKSFSLTGWKIGWVCAPPDLSAAVRTAHQFITFATATPLQWGAIAAVEAPPAYYASLHDEYAARRAHLAHGLEAAGFDVYWPEGTYFVAAGFSRFGFDDDVAFVRHLIADRGVAVIPPSGFYLNPEHGRSWVRFAFCKRTATIDEALRRLAPTAQR
jgi:N-succinyldiaminopimelate aminotransferase